MFASNQLVWTREPQSFSIADDRIVVETRPHTDLWQRTYYHFRNDNAPVLQMKTSEPFFSFVVKTTFDTHHRFDQCGVVIYLNSDTWLKASIEYETEEFQHLGSVVTNTGIPTGLQRLLMLPSNPCGIVSAVVRMIFALNVRQMENISRKCVFAICGKQPAKFNLAFTHAVRKILLSRQHFPTWM